MFLWEWLLDVCGSNFGVKLAYSCETDASRSAGKLQWTKVYQKA